MSKKMAANVTIMMLVVGSSGSSVTLGAMSERSLNQHCRLKKCKSQEHLQSLQGSAAECRGSGLEPGLPATMADFGQ